MLGSPQASPQGSVYKGFLTHGGFFVPQQTLVKRLTSTGYAQLLKKLTITCFQKVGAPKIAKMYTIAVLPGTNLQCVYLPRTLMKILGKFLTIDNLLTPIQYVTIPLTLELYENQNLITEYLQNLVFTPQRIAAGTATCMLNLRAGQGKTFVAAGLISRLGLKCLYVVPMRPLAVQAVRDLKSCFDPKMIGRFDKKKKSENVSITVIVINSAIMQTAEFFQQFGLVILDEVHMYCTEHRKAIFNLTTHCVLGMSATTEDRRDKFDPIAQKALAFDGIIRAENIPGFTYEDINFNCHARIVAYNGPPEYTQNLTHEATGRVFTHYMHNQFISDPYRMQLFIAELTRLYDWRDANDNKHHIYIFAEEVEILRLAKAAFEKSLRKDILDDVDAPELIDEVDEDNKTDKTDTKMFTGKQKETEITNIILHGRVLFATFGFASTGTSILKMSAIMFLTPRRANMKQVCARILRRGSNVDIPRIVVDLVDNKTLLRAQLGERKLAYDFYGFTTEYEKINYDKL
jgi:superfamily II DNA or RNA helicase